MAVATPLAWESCVMMMPPATIRGQKNRRLASVLPYVSTSRCTKLNLRSAASPADSGKNPATSCTLEKPCR